MKDPISMEEHIVNFETMIWQAGIHACWLQPFNLPLNYFPDEQGKKRIIASLKRAGYKKIYLEKEGHRTRVTAY